MSKFVKLYLEISGKIRELVIIIALVLDPWEVFNIAPITKLIKQTLPFQTKTEVTTDGTTDKETVDSDWDRK